MKWAKLLKVAVSVIAAGLLVFLIVARINPLDLIKRTRIYLFSNVSSFGSFVAKLNTLGSLTRENLILKEENLRLLSQLAAYSESEEQNRFFREALKLDNLTEYKIIDSRAFNLQFTPEGHYMLINKGTLDGVETGGAVISSSGVLIGQIVDTYRDSSRVELITDPDFKVTVKLLNNGTTGIARGSLGDGVLLDFISQNDEVQEGNVVVTSGSDLFPSGLILGSVKKIEPDDGNLFKKITVKPEFESIDIDRVLILNK